MAWRVQSVAGVRKMMMLVWSKDVAIKEHVITAYRQLFLQRPAEGVPRQQKAMAIATALVGLVIVATLGEVTSLEEIMTDMVKQDHIKDSTLAALVSWRHNAARKTDLAATPSIRNVNFCLVHASGD
jgi:condensin complex subunit 1